MSHAEAKKRILEHLLEHGRATNSKLKVLLGGDSEFFDEIRDLLIMDGVVDDVRGAGLELTAPSGAEPDHVDRLEVNYAQGSVAINADLAPTADETNELRADSSQHIFISYGHDEHAKLARRLKSDLEAIGHTVWLDESEIRLSQDWEVVIEEGISGAHLVISMLTPHSVRRPDGVCLDELSFARFQGKRIVPLMVRDCLPPLCISRLQWLDMQEWERDYEPKFAQIRDVIDGRLQCFEGSQTLLLDSLRPIDFRGEIDEKRRDFFGREWVFEDIATWVNDESASKVFFLTGHAGVGKTAISAVLCHTEPMVAAYHLCCHGDTTKSNALKCVFSLAYQLSTQLPEYREKLVALDISELQSESALAVFDTLIVQPLASVSSPERPKIIVIDALDEATHEGRNEMVRFLAQAFMRTPAWLRLFVTSRPERLILNALSRFQPHRLDTTDSRNLTDIRQFLERELALLSSGPVPVASIDIIIERSEGVFLYVTMVLQDLRSGLLSLTSPDTFPQGLMEVYERFFSRHFGSEDIEKHKVRLAEYDRDQRPLLELVTAAQEPLMIEFIAAVLGWDVYKKKRCIDALASLFTLRDGRLHPFHRSIRDWLTDERTCLDFFIDSGKGHARLAAFGWGLYQTSVDKLDWYSLGYLPSHLSADRRIDDLQAVLTNFEFIETKVAVVGPRRLVEDYDLLNLARNEPLGLIQSALMLSSHVVSGDSTQLAGQLASRLEIHASSQPRIREFVDHIHVTHRHPCWFARHGSLTQAGGALLRTLAGHSDSVVSVAISPDGATMVSGSGDETVKVWDLHRGEELRSLEGHSDSVTSVAISSDGATVVSGSEDKTVKVWNLHNGKELRTLTGHSGAVETVAISADGESVVSGSRDETLKVWNLNSGEELRTLAGHSDSVMSVAISSDGATVVSGSWDKTVKVWELHSGKQMRTLIGHSDLVMSVAISPNGMTVVSGGWDKTVKVWNPESGEELLTLAGHSHSVMSVAISLDGATLVSGSHDETVKVWNLHSGEEMRTLAGHSGWVDSVALSPDGATVVSGSWDKTVKVWEHCSGEELHALAGQAESVDTVAISPDGTTVVSGNYDKTLKVWNAYTGEALRTLEGHSFAVMSVAISPDGATVVSGSWDNTVKVWGIHSGELLRTLVGHSEAVTSVAISIDGTTVVSGSGDKTVKVWNIHNGELLRTLVGHSGLVMSVAISPDGATVVSGGWDKTVKVWDLHSGEELRTLTGHSHSVRSVSISPDGSTVVSGSWDNSVKVWDLHNGKLLHTLAGHSGTVRSVVISSDGATVISGSHDKTVKVWDLHSGELQSTFTADQEIVSCVVGGDDATVVAGGSAGMLYFLHRSAPPSR